jgi:hypothetical protein
MYAVITKETNECVVINDLKQLANYTDYKYDTVVNWFRNNKSFHQTTIYIMYRVGKVIKSNKGGLRTNIT